MVHTKSLEKEIPSSKANLTLKLDKDVIRKVRVMAAEKDTSISEFVADLIREHSNHSERYEAARKSAIAFMNSGIELKWEKPASRDEMHERR